MNDEIMNETFETFKALLARDDWNQTLNDEKGNIGHTLPSDPIDIFRGTAMVDYNNVELANLFYGLGADEWNKFDENTTSFEVREEYETGSRLVWQTHHLPWPLWDRDFLLMNKRFEEDGVVYLIYRSAGIEEPELAKKYQRGVIHCAGFAFFPVTETTCRVERIVNTDPMGNIPSKVVNLTGAAVFQLNERIGRILA
eukprot:TRINITY_DN10637_c0_g1_i1.p1 TRINITY_DN10637_c0_g1~~TRINITY_DN10637_c0_g1_i1.p1  ORF type:complete len:198 (+),score=40.70 TRINITY_DN10637_c0_g1_i1:58-651(+)